MNSTPLLTFDDVGFSYGKEQVLSHCSFEVQKGSHLVLKGASGSGKSTILKLILGFFHPQEGEIRYRGDRLTVNLSKELRRQTAWLSADVELGEGTVQEVIRFPFEFNINASDVPADEQILGFFDRLNLERDLYVKPFRDLSTGQRQRVGLVLCVLLDKPLFLLDEPTSALDAESKERVIDLLMNSGKGTIISTSHDPVWLEHADQIYEL